MRATGKCRILWLGLGCCCCLAVSAAESFRVVTYNLENYILAPSGTRPAKTPEGRAKIYQSLSTAKPDVLALQEVGDTNALFDLQAGLRAAGVDLPFWEHVTGFDTNIHVAILSRFPILRRRPHTNDTFLHFGRRFRVSRGFAEVDIQVKPGYFFTLVTAHLKSRRPVAYGDQAELREQEAAILRGKIEERLSANPQCNLVVLGDFNDSKDSPTIRTLMGRGNKALIDARPAERSGDDQPHPNPRYDPRNITWTHHYGKEDTYSRIDYILLSRGMAREWQPDETYIVTLPNWGVASDHRPLVISFRAEDK